MINNLHIPINEKRENYANEFDRVAKELLNSYLITTPKNQYLIRELEFYYYSKNHKDIYCHKNERQLMPCSFYFHRYKHPEKYLNLKQKGIDITLGNTADIYCGILIRAIQNINSKLVYTGIGKITNQIIDEIGGVNRISELYLKEKQLFDDQSPLKLMKTHHKNLKVFKKQRQGLNHKKEDAYRFFLDAKYNYFTYPEIEEIL